MSQEKVGPSPSMRRKAGVPRSGPKRTFVIAASVALVPLLAAGGGVPQRRQCLVLPLLLRRLLAPRVVLQRRGQRRRRHVVVMVMMERRWRHVGEGRQRRGRAVPMVERMVMVMVWGVGHQRGRRRHGRRARGIVAVADVVAARGWRRGQPTAAQRCRPRFARRRRRQVRRQRRWWVHVRWTTARAAGEHQRRARALRAPEERQRWRRYRTAALAVRPGGSLQACV